jgi:hypothetical protein
MSDINNDPFLKVLGYLGLGALALFVVLLSVAVFAS